MLAQPWRTLYTTLIMALCAFAITHKEDKILLVKIAPPFKEAYKWNFPGGVIERGEDLKEGLAREVLEETGISCKITTQRDQFSTENPDNDITIFEAEYQDGSIAVQEEEILEAAWFTAAEALELELAFDIRKYITEAQ